MKRLLLTACFQALILAVPQGFAASVPPVVPAADPSAELAVQSTKLRAPVDATRTASIRYLQQYAGGVKTLVQSLVPALSDKTAEVRNGAVRALADIGPSARDASPFLIPLLNDKDETVRGNSALALGEIGVPSDAALCGLAFLLHDSSATVRGQAAQALGKLGTPALAHRDALFDMLNDPSRETAANAALALASLGEPVPEAARLYILALSRDTIWKKQAENALRKIGAPAVAALQVAVKEEKERYARREAVLMLGKLGESARPAIPALVALYAEKDTDLQNYATMDLLDLGAVPMEGSGALIRVMRDWPEYRAKVLAAFEKMNAHACDVPLAVLNSKDDVTFHREAARVLGRLAPRFKHNPEPLLAQLNHPDAGVREFIVNGLPDSGIDAKRLAAALVPLIYDTNYNVAIIAIKTLGAMPTEPSAVLALAQARLDHSNISLKGEAGKVVLALGPDALPALSVLREGVISDDQSFRDWALQGIANIGPAAAEAVPDVVECLVRFVPSRGDTQRVLGRLGEKAVGPLMVLLSAADPAVRSSAAAALGYVGAPALVKLTAALSNENPDTVEAALSALARMAPASFPALPELLRAANSKVPKIQNGAVEAISRLGPLAAPALIAEMKKPDEKVRHMGESLLSQTGSKSVPLIVETLRAEQDPAIVLPLIDCLSRNGPAAAEGVPAILDTAGRLYGAKDRATVWTHCASALASIGAARETAVPVLFSMLSSEEKAAHADAYGALRKLGGEDVRVPPLGDALRNALPAYVGGALKPFGRAGMLQLAAEMAAGTVESRDAAALAFVSLAPECLPFLLQTLDENGPAALGAVVAVGEIRAYEIQQRAAKAAPKPLEELQKALEACSVALNKKALSNNPDEALAAAWALGKAGPAGLEAVIKSLAACAPEIRPRGIVALGYYDLHGQAGALVPALPIILKETGDPVSPLRKQAAALLLASGYCAESVPALVAALEDPEHHTSQIAAAALASMGPLARGAVPKLIEILDRGTPQAAAAAGTALNAIGSDAVPLLIKAMASDNLKLRGSAYTALSTLKLAPHINLLADLASDPREEVCVHALQLIAAAKEEGLPAEAKVRALLARDNDTIFHECVKTLAKMGANVFAALQPIADHPNEDIALRAIKEMRGVTRRSDDVRPFIAKELKNVSPQVRAAALALLPGKEEGAAESLPLAALAMKDASSAVRKSAIVWLFDNAPFQAAKALPILIDGIKDTSETVSSVSQRALIQLGEKARPAIPELKKLLADPSKPIQINAARVLVKLNVENAMAVLIYNESSISAQVAEYHEKQERYFEEHFTPENVHYFAATLLDAWGAEGKKQFANASDADGTLNLTGYKLKILTGQSARAEGGKKDWLSKGVLSGGHALLAWPADPAVTGRVAYMSGPDGALYERPVGPQDGPRMAEFTAAFDPGPEWTKTFTPVKGPPPIPHSYFKPKGTDSEQLEF